MTTAYSRTTLNGDAWWWGVPLVYVPKGPSQIYLLEPDEVDDCPCAAQCIERFVMTGIECPCKCHEPR